MSYPYGMVPITSNRRVILMRKVLFLVGGLVLLSVAVLLANANAASAKVTNSEKRDYVIYVRELAPEVAPRFSDTVLLAMGKRVCKDYRRGIAEDAIAETIERMYLNSKVHFNFTARILQASQLYFCPKFI